MASLVMKPEYQLGLSAQELRLICLALSGRIDFSHENGADQKAAKELGDKLFNLRATQTMEYAKVVQPKQGEPE